MSLKLFDSSIVKTDTIKYLILIEKIARIERLYMTSINNFTTNNILNAILGQLATIFTNKFDF